MPAAIDAAFARLESPEEHRYRPNRYYRQYGGFLRYGKRVLHVNAVDDFIGEMVPGEWREKLINVC
ncbi:MAG TPA: hypothetical protein VFQ46_08400, partial [Candidatus Limnocylindria bacterium]|nr:hypothetical protein [Candidatus Limnocylindria bacterium]